MVEVVFFAPLLENNKRNHDSHLYTQTFKIQPISILFLNPFRGLHFRHRTVTKGTTGKKVSPFLQFYFTFRLFYSLLKSKIVSMQDIRAKFIYLFQRSLAKGFEHVKEGYMVTDRRYKLLFYF